MRLRALLRLFAALLTLSLVAAACGDDGSTSEAAAASGGADTADRDAVDDEMNDDEHDDHDHDDHDHDDHAAAHDDVTDDQETADHAHGLLEFEGSAVPTVAVDVAADPAGGINVHVTTDNFVVAPAAASTEHVEGEGHFHLYVDGEKVLRFYNTDIYFGGVTEGEVEVTVELSTNDHNTYAVDGAPIAATTTFSVPEHSHDAHSHGDVDDVEFTGPAPELSVRVEPDPKSGYNAFITVDGLELSAEHASGDHVDGEGHLHIYANGQKLGRLYGLATHIPALPAGDVEITVAAYTNDHRAYVVDGAAIEASTTIEVSR